MKTLTIPQLIDKLDARRGAFFATIEARVDARLVKKHRETGEANPYAGATKYSRVNGCLNWCYANSVNNQIKREATEGEAVLEFTPEQRRWGQRRFVNAEGKPVYDRLLAVRMSPFVDHKQAVYLEMKVERSLEHQYEAADGSPLTDEQVAPYLPARGNEARRQGVERPVILRDYTLEKDGESNILSITMDGEKYVIV